MTRDDLPAEPVEDLDDRLREPELEKLRQRLFTVERWRGSLRTFLDDVYERTQILGPHDGGKSPWRFWHRTFREALTAERLQALREAEGEDAVLALVARLDEEGEGRWAEPFALLAGRLGKDADAFVLRLDEVNRRLGSRALAAAQGLEPATLRKMLERRESWSERSEVYLRLPEQFAAAAACLEFIDRLRKETRDGNDLFFLDRAALLTGERWPDAGEAVEALRARLFDHVPRPPEELFQWIDTPHDGRVELWREIRAGSRLEMAVNGRSPPKTAAMTAFLGQLTAFLGRFSAFPRLLLWSRRQEEGRHHETLGTGNGYPSWPQPPHGSRPAGSGRVARGQTGRALGGEP